MARILILEADRQLARYTADYLSRQGHEVSFYCDPQTAITATDAGPPDLIILNLSLAGRSGIEFLYELRSYPDWQAVPAIATGRLTHDEQLAYGQAFSQLGVSGFVPKDGATLRSLAAAASQILQTVKT